ncbi:MAG: hypothetical protein CML19_02445 [Pusillimonas sp.]|nr:hypothetical protein [Pusillimonas sp.]
MEGFSLMADNNNNNDDDYYEDPDTTTSIGAGRDAVGGGDKNEGPTGGDGFIEVEPELQGPLGWGSYNLGGPKAPLGEGLSLGFMVGKTLGGSYAPTGLSEGTYVYEGGDADKALSQTITDEFEPEFDEPPPQLSGIDPYGVQYNTYNQGFKGLTREDYESPYFQEFVSKQLSGLTGKALADKAKELGEIGLLDPLQLEALDPEVDIGYGGWLGKVLGDEQGRYSIGWRDQDFPDYNPNYADMMFPTQSMKEAYGFNPDTGTWADTSMRDMFSRDIAGRQLGEIGRQARANNLNQNQLGSLIDLVGAPATTEFDIAEKLGGAKSYAQALAEGYTVDQIKEAQEGAEAAARALGRSEDYEPYAQAYSGYLSKGLEDFFSKDELGYGKDAPTPIDVALSTSGGKFVRDPSYVKQVREGLEEFASGPASLIPGASFITAPINLLGFGRKVYDKLDQLDRRQEAIKNVNEVTGSNYDLPSFFGDISNRVSERFSDIGEKFSGVPDRLSKKVSSLSDIVNLPLSLIGSGVRGLTGLGDFSTDGLRSFDLSNLFGDKGFNLSDLFQLDPDPPVYALEDEKGEKRTRTKKTWTYARKKALADKLGKDISDLTKEDYADNDEFDIVEEYSEGGGVTFLGETETMENNNQKTITDSISLLNQFARTGTTGMMGIGNTTPSPPMLPEVIDREVATGGNNEEALRSLIMEDVNSYGGGAVSGEGDGTSDDIEAFIEEDTEVMMAGGGGLSALAGSSGKLDNYLPQVSERGRQAARLSDGEFVIPADVVANIGNGSTKAGNDQLYKMMDQVRKIKTGKTEQPQDMPAKPIDLLGIG